MALTLITADNIDTTTNPMVNAITVSTNTATIGTAAYFVANGNIGIGTSTPNTTLVIASSTTLAAGDPSIILQGNTNTERIHIRSGNIGQPVVLLQGSRGTIAAPTATQSGDPLGYYQLGGYNGTSWARSAWISGLAAENWTSTARGSVLTFSTTPIGNNTIAEVARIDSSGNMGIGVTPNTWSTVTALQMAGPSMWGSAGVGHWSINTYFDGTYYKYINTGAVTDYYQLSGTHVWRYAASGTAGANVSLSEAMRIDSSGRVTKPSQPYLRAVTSSTAQSLTGGQTYVIPYNVISAQNGSNYNNSTYRFTCPVAGQYFVHAAVEGSSITTNYYNLFLRINGSGFAGTYVTGRNSAYEQISTTGIVSASASDYIDVALFVNQTGGTLELNPGDTRNSLYIYLLG